MHITDEELEEPDSEPTSLPHHQEAQDIQLNYL